MIITPDQRQLMEDMLGIDGYVMSVVTTALELNRASKIKYLQRAIRQPGASFNLTLDEVNGLYPAKCAERLDIIRSLKLINDLYHNNEAKFAAEAPIVEGTPAFLNPPYSATRRVLNHYVGFEIENAIRYQNQTGEDLKKLFQDFIQRKIQDATQDLYIGQAKQVIDQRRQLRELSLLKPPKSIANPEWRLELNLPEDQLLESQKTASSESSCDYLEIDASVPGLIIFRVYR
jgi:hypothetical protein